MIELDWVYLAVAAGAWVVTLAGAAAWAYELGHKAGYACAAYGLTSNTPFARLDIDSTYHGLVAGYAYELVGDEHGHLRPVERGRL